MSPSPRRVAHVRQPLLAFRPHGPASERGFTLIEVIVAIGILAIIVVPLSTTFIAGFQVTSKVTDSVGLSVSRDQLASQWANDVASVDAAGVSTAETTSCETTPARNDLLLATFNSTKVNASGTPVLTRVSWYTSGNGKQVDINRVVCKNVAMSQVNSRVGGGDLVPVAQDVGTKGQTGQQVFGLYADSKPCTEFQCGLNLPYAKPREIIITAQRRVFGAGVPLQVGRLYSSSATRQAAGPVGVPPPGVAYGLYGTNGTLGVTEGVLGPELSLPYGLEGDPAMMVEWAIQQETTGNWLQANAAPAAPTFRPLAVGADRPWIAGDDSPGYWRLMLTAGATGQLNAGGKYKVYTRLTEQGSAPKTYGGVNGFPFWMDWKETDSVFVKPGGSCATNDGLTAATPVCSILTGLNLARTANRPQVLVNNNGGTPYTGTVNIEGANYENNRTLVGGLDANWLRLAPTETNGRTRIVGARNTAVGAGNPGYSDTSTGLLVDGKTGIRVRQFDISSNAGATAEGPAGYSAYGVRALNIANTPGSDLSIEHSAVTGKNGTTGANGTGTASNGGAGCNGNNGSNGGGGDDGGSSCGGDGPRAGGRGGDGGNYSSAGQAGSTGAGGAAGGSGGCGSLFGCGTPPGGGTSGARGNPGAGGAGAANTVNGNPGATWVGRSGSGGGVGTGGGGGGGGGGGISASAWGGGGGAGGTGGQPGGGAVQGGSYGGGSFGVYAFRARVSISNSTITAGSGGTGGRGSAGGTGGNGGNGGNGGGKSCCEASGGGGGGGGSGGGGGGGAGGGAAGPSIAVYSAVDSGGGFQLTTTTGNTFNRPATGTPGGPGGAGGVGGQNGGVAGGVSTEPAIWPGTTKDCSLIGGVCPSGGQNGRLGFDGNTGNTGATGLLFRIWNNGVTTP